MEAHDRLWEEILRTEGREKDMEAERHKKIDGAREGKGGRKAGKSKARKGGGQ